jgi:hypothetical protein
MMSYEGFVWPESGPVEAPDWRDDNKPNSGLFGLLWGEGYSGYLSWDVDAKWLIVEVERSDIRNLDRMYKFSHGNVILCGCREEAVRCIQRAAPGAAVCFGTTIVGDGGIATTGDNGTATAGDDGTATAGNFGASTAGNDGTATAGNHGTATAGYGGIATTGFYGTATAGSGGTATAIAGNEGTAIVGDGGIATAGNWGTATAGNWGTAIAGSGGTTTAGNDGTAIVGDGGIATAGNNGILISKFLSAEGMPERRVAMVGQGGILPNTPYRCVQGEWEMVEV